MERIGAVAQRPDVTVSPRTIIRLEKSGAIHVKRDRNGARVFDEQDIARLRAILYPEPTEAER